MYPYTCTTTFVGGASFTENAVPVGITDLNQAPGVHSYPGGQVTARVQVIIPASPAAVTALLGTGTTDWTSANAALVWGGVRSPATPFSWRVPPSPYPPYSDLFPILFTTASFQIPGPGDVAPGELSWDFQANPGTQAGFESGHTQCTPVAPVQIYATFLRASGPSCAHDRDQWTCRFSYTGANQLWQVPADVTHVTLDVRGASGAMTMNPRGRQGLGRWARR